ncbi:MAG: glutamine amidotransferase [Acidobacteria bacterium]|nr:glutamine amidotransferase [Acidobacteriota bacterium]
MRPLLIIKAGEPNETITRRHGSFEDWILARMTLPREGVQIVDVFRDARLPDPASVSGAIVTGSLAMVTECHPWAEATAAWLRTAIPAGLPVLGICFGHQLLAHAFGGRVGDNPRGREIGTVQVRLLGAAREDALFGALPGELTVQVTHLQSVLTLPPGAVRLAENGHEPNHAFRIGPRAWGVQFHPEITHTIMRALIGEQHAALATEGLDPNVLKRTVRSSAVGRRILERFTEIARKEAAT